MELDRLFLLARVVAHAIEVFETSELARDWLETENRALGGQKPRALLNTDAGARDAGLSVNTSRRYLEYLRLSYQAFLLPPWHTNLTSQVIKTPKVYWLDPGLWRHLAGYQGEATGQLFETLVVGEIYKWIKTKDLPIELSFYRTRSRLEVDLMLSTPHGVWALEVKSGRQLGGGDWRSLRVVGEALGDKWRGGLVVHRGLSVDQVDHNLWAVPVDRLLV